MGCPSAAVLANFVDGDLAAAEITAVEVHIDTCAGCRQTVSAAARRGTADPVAAADGATPGDRVGRYLLLSQLGAGAMGVVFAAQDPELDRRIAVKLLAGGGARNHGRETRLAREARALAKISHPHVVPVHDVGVTDGGRLFIAMELVDGETLREHVAGTAVGLRRRIELVAQAGRGLAAAHAAGVVHRDFKPDNVLVGRDGRVRVGDFGLAAADDPEAAADATDDRTSDPRITRSGALLGTPAYMAPEQLRGEPATVASDQFALCVTAWEIAFGRRPFAGTTPGALAEAIGAGAIALPPRGSRRIAAALRRGLAADPARRYPDVAAAVTAIERAARPSLTPRVLAAAVVLVAGAGVALATRAPDVVDPCARVADRIAQVWHPRASAALGAAFGRTASPLAAESAAAAGRALDRAAVRWSAAATEHCVAYRAGRRSAELYDRQTACLDERAAELAALLAVFEHANAATVERAVAAVTAAADVAACTAPAPGTAVTPSHAAETARARPVFAEGRALRRTGKHADAVRILAPLATIADPRLAAEVEVELGIASSGLGELAAGRDHLSRAVARADAARDDELRSRALIESIALVGDEAVSLAEASRLEDQARAAVERAGGDPLLRADLAVAIGNVQLRRGEPAASAKSFEAAIAVFRAQDPVDAIRLGNALNSGAGARLTLGDHAGGLAMLEAALAAVEPALGPHHPHVAAVWGTMVQPLYFLDRVDDAIAAAKRATELYEAAFGPDHPRLAAALDNLAIVYSLTDHHVEALPIFTRVRTIMERRLGPDHVDVGTAWLNSAAALKGLERLDEAAAAYRQALAIWEPALGTDHLDVARAVSGLGDVELRRGAPERAVPLLERAVAIRARGDGDPDLLASDRFRLARALRAAGRPPGRAIDEARAARDHYARTDATDDVADIDRWLADTRRSP